MKQHPLMSDGRNFTNWQPVALVNETIRRRERLKTDMDYRAYLQKNADSIRSYNMSIAMHEVSNFPTVSYESQTGTPHLYKTKTLPEAPKYQTSDLKEWFFRIFNV
jgi:hypothetical protein